MIGQLVAERQFGWYCIDTIPEVKPSFWKSFNKAAGCFAVGEVLNGDIDDKVSISRVLDKILTQYVFRTGYICRLWVIR